jgi:hypothetical protein
MRSEPDASVKRTASEEGAAPDQGEVDLSLLEYLLSLTPAERVEKHYHARLFAQRMQEIARQRYGPALDALEAAD